VKRLADYWVGGNVALLWTGQVLSQAGDSVYMIALMWMMLELTGSKAITGLAAMAAYLPTLLFGLLAGAVADRFNRRRTMAFADLLRAALVLVIPLLAWTGRLEGSGGALALGVVTFAVACVSTLFNPSRDALIPDLVEEGKLNIANGMIQTSWQLAMFAGPLLAGLLLGLVSIVWLFVVDAATFGLSMVFILLLPASVGLVRGRADGGEQRTAGSILEGLKHAWSDRRLRGLVWITASYNLLLMGLPFVGTPVYVREVLDNRPETYAWLQAVYAGGMLPGIGLAHWLGRRVRAGTLVLVGIILDGLTFTPFFFIDTVGTALVFMAVHSVVIPLILVPRTTLVQTLAPRELWGRVFSIVNVCIVGFSALSAALVGLVAEVLPVTWIFMIFGVASGLVGVLGFADRSFARAGEPPRRAPRGRGSEV
jgi:MFS family permease